MINSKIKSYIYAILSVIGIVIFTGVGILYPLFLLQVIVGVFLGFIIVAAAVTIEQKLEEGSPTQLEIHREIDEFFAAGPPPEEDVR